MNGNQKKIGLLVAVICTAIVLIVFAAVHTLKSVNNSFVPADTQIAIIENGTQLSSNDNYIKLDENEGSEDFTATKKVCIKNTGGSNPVPLYTRVCIFPKFTNQDGSRQIEKLSGFPATITGSIFEMGDVTFYLDENWRTNWQYKDNYFYYIGKGDSKAGVLDVGDTTAPLLKSVSINAGTYKTDYTDKHAYLKVVVLADSIQTVGNAVENRWNNSSLTSNDAERPNVSTDEESTAVVAAFSLAQRRANDATTSDSAVMPVTQYEMNRVQNMISSTTASVIYQPPEGDWASDFEDELKKNNILDEDEEEEETEVESSSPSVDEEY